MYIGPSITIFSCAIIFECAIVRNMDNSQDTIIVRKDKPFMVRLEGSLKSELLRQSVREGVSAAAIIRMALRAYLEPKTRGKYVR